MANEKILVVDDDTNICELLRLYLTKEAQQRNAEYNHFAVFKLAPQLTMADGWRFTVKGRQSWFYGT